MSPESFRMCCASKGKDRSESLSAWLRICRIDFSPTPPFYRVNSVVEIIFKVMTMQLNGLSENILYEKIGASYRYKDYILGIF